MAHFEFFDAPPEVPAEQVRLRAEIAAQSFWLAGAKLALLAVKTNFNPAQPRVPAGNPAGGQWAPGGGGRAGRFSNHQTKRPKSDPTLSMTSKERDSARRADVLKGEGGDFFVAPNPSANPNAPGYEDPSKSQVGIYNKEIELVAARENVDPDLIRTIMYIETTHGQYFGIGPLADALGISKTILPMNIYASLWGKLGSRSYLEIPINNITAGAKILKGIIGNLAEPSVAVVATLYNALDATSVSDYGARAAAVYKARPWKTP